MSKVLRDDALGVFRLEASLDAYYGRIRIGPLDVEASFDDGDARELVERIARMQRLVGALLSDERLFRVAAAGFLLALYNDDDGKGDQGGGWRDGRAVLDADGFARRLRLKSITLNSDGSSALWYDDGGLFWDHTIVLDLSSDFAPLDATIEG